ncbi:protein archease-like [Myxocyprinus asiaticus]|uniref:protein archease-like n=1 Tax=Myxocyprinus asiaticus TaxID=70543 RepID=UPI0022234E26|nr:protein archease-like [Myxocyprinus asiaticus]
MTYKIGDGNADSFRGDSLEDIFKQCAMGMFGYMTDTEIVDNLETMDIFSDEDMESLLFHFLHDWLFKFSADLFFIPREVKVVHIDRMQFRIRSIGWGKYVYVLHFSQGTEVKAIIYSAMQVHDKEKPEIFVIIDI